MKTLFIVPGSGDPFYCGNCFRDNLQANALRSAGHDVVVMPLYLPLTHPSFEGNTPLFFPATTFYVAQKFFDRRPMPHWLERTLNAPSMLRVAASFSGSTSAGGMEGLTLAMIEGSGEAFRQQVEPLVDWIAHHERPDVIHLSSTLVIGVAKAIKQRIANIPIVCSLQDEEVWLDALAKPFADKAWRGIAESIKYVDSFVASSFFYKKKAQAKLPQFTDIHVIYPGVDIAKYATDTMPEKPTIGFFYHMNEANGLRILVDAFTMLKASGTVPDLRLKVGGGYTSVDKKFLHGVKKILEPYEDSVDWCDTYTLSSHTGFYRDISAICVPITFDEGVGLYLCEAFAAGRPAIEPATGSFSEVVSNAGITYAPNSSDELANVIARLFSNQALYARCRSHALHLSQTRYNRAVAAEMLTNVYKELTK